MKLDPFRSHSVTSLQQLGASAVAALVDVVEARADARDESYVALALGDAAVPTLVHVVGERAAAHAVTFAEEARDLPREWRNIVLAAAALDGILETQTFAGALRHVQRAKDMRELRAFFVELELDAFANAFDEAQLYAAELEDGVDPMSIEELGSLLLVEEIDAGDVRRALTQAAAMVGDAFPAAD